MSNTTCKSCNTSWDDCEILDGVKCASCLRAEVELLRAALADIRERADWDLRNAARGQSNRLACLVVRQICDKAANAAEGGGE